jgi:BirA family biotin operon repressor/biotin-[acetyl-CoA-carboxylase] ligase
MLEAHLKGLPLGRLYAYTRLSSTNDEALRLAKTNAPDLTLVYTEEQTAGKGRAGRRWYTPAGAGLAFSLLLLPPQENNPLVSRITALGALAVCQALQQEYAQAAQIKWPNDVLVYERKLAGVLAESHWTGGQLAAIILGIGINVAPESVAEAEKHEQRLLFPATCLEDVLHRQVDRLELLHYTLERLVYWRKRIDTAEFVEAWETNLAFRGELVQLIPAEISIARLATAQTSRSPGSPLEGWLAGLAEDGSLKLRTRTGEVVLVRFGDVRLRPVEDSA